MKVSVIDSQSAGHGIISDPDILTGSRYEQEFGLFDSVFHEVSNAIVIIARDSESQSPVISDVNHHFELVTGHTLEHIRSKNLYDFLGDNSTSPDRQIIEQVIHSRQSAVFFCPWITATGKVLDINMTIRPFTSEEDDSRFICVLRENKPENKSRDQAAREIKRNLLAAMHHNFRTPLNGILGYSEVIMTEMLGPVGQDSYRDYARDIHGAGQDLLQLIDNLLELKELETTEFELHEERFTLIDLLAGCLKKVSPDAAKANIHLSSNVEEDFPVIYGDKCRLQQVVHSLLTNALKFTASGGKITLSAELAADGSCIINCVDNGVGMPSQQLAKVFSHDTHLSDIYSNPTVGIGFGLSYVKQMIERHGGTVSIISALGQGAKVSLHLPAHRLD
tara:strand:- start:799 stop:1974 length:1176 start_codon:yes stop_codon:yes gene_type:complete